ARRPAPSRARSRSAAAKCRRAWRPGCRRNARRAAGCLWHRSVAAPAAPQRIQGPRRARAHPMPAAPGAESFVDAAPTRSLLAADDMDVEMEHDLAPVGAVVCDSE